MENATKALLISAGIFFGILIMTTLLFAVNQVADYYQSRAANRATAKIATFNKQYIIYQKENLRGTELLSLINKIISFNKTKADEDPEIEISIEIGKTEEAKNFYYKYGGFSYGTNDDITLIEIDETYVHENQPGKINIQEVLEEVSTIESEITKSKAEKLASNLPKLIIDESLPPGRQAEAEEEKKEFLVKLGCTVSEFEGIKNDILKYYQYQQFKRARFECKIAEFTQTGRILRFEVEFINKFE